MKFIQFAILLTGAAIASAGPAPQAAATTTSPCSAAVSAIPSCGVACITSAASVVGCTNPTDFACQCASSASAAIVATAFDCVLSSCGLVTGLDVSASANAVCTACA